MGGTCSSHEGDKMCILKFTRETQREERTFEDIGQDGRVIFKLLKKTVCDGRERIYLAHDTVH
jgi:hypothetical protein